MLKMVKLGQVQRARNLVSQGGTFLQFFTWTPTPYNLFAYKYGAKQSLEGCQLATLARTGGNMITKRFFGQIFLRCNSFAL